MAKELPYFKMYPKDFDTDESARLMDIREAGLYLYCLNHAWINEGLPSDPEEISRALRVGRQDFNAAWPRVSKCFILRAGRLINQRQEEERDDAISKGNSNSKSANLRWARKRERDLAEANAMRTQCERNATNTDAMRTHSEPTDESHGIQDDISYLDDTSTNGANGHANALNSHSERNANAVPRAYESDSDSSITKKPTNNGNASVSGDSWFEEIYSRHPKKKNRGIAATYLSEITVDREEFDRVHLLWCVEWAKEKPQFAPELSQWILDQGWKYPPNSNGNGSHGKTQPTGCPVCKVKPCVCYERQLAREAAANEA